MTFWSEAFTLLEKMGNIPKDHGVASRVARELVAPGLAVWEHTERS